MANAAKGQVPLKLPDGREFTLVLDFEMRVAVEDQCDKPFDHVAARAIAGFNGAVRALVWGSLRRFHSDLSMEDVTALIESHGAEVEAALVKAAEAAAPDAKPEGKDGKNPPKPRRSKNSGASGAKPA